MTRKGKNLLAARVCRREGGEAGERNSVLLATSLRRSPRSLRGGGGDATTQALSLSLFPRVISKSKVHQKAG